MIPPTVDLADPDTMIGALTASHAHLDRLDTTPLTGPTRCRGGRSLRSCPTSAQR